MTDRPAEACPVCGGDESKCNYDPASDICWEMERMLGDKAKQIYDKLTGEHHGEQEPRR